jgi:chromosomal replication initiation ATPase DnaA
MSDRPPARASSSAPSSLAPSRPDQPEAAGNGSGGIRPQQSLLSLKEELFLQALEEVRREHDGVELRAGLKGIQLLDWADSTLHLEVPHEFSRRLFDHSVRPFLEASLKTLTGTVIRLRLHVKNAASHPAPKRVRRYRTGRADLSDFIQDPANRRAYGLVMEYTTGKPLFDPFLVCGPSRCGKTHLLRGLFEKLRAREDDPGSVIYMTAPAFSRAFRATRYRRRLESFKLEMDAPRILILDDLHRIATMPATQRAVVQLLERRQMRAHLTLFGSREPPDGIHGLDASLRTRLQGGMLATMRRLSPESLARHLKSRLKRRGVRLDQSVIERAVHLSEGNPITAETLILDAVAVARNQRRPLTTASIAPPCLPTGADGPDWRRIAGITDRIAAFFGVSTADLRSPRKVRRALAPRRLLALALRQGFALTSAEIGRYLGGRSVSTVTVLLRQGKALIEEDPSLREMFQHCLNEADHEPGRE